MEINKIYKTDCSSSIKEIGDNCVDLIITDPPYNIGQENKRTKVGNKIMTNNEAWGEWDNQDKDEYDKFIIEYMKECYRILNDGGSFYMFSAREDNGFFIRHASKIGFTYKNQIVMLKLNPLPHFAKTNFRSAFELCFYMTKGDKPKTFNFLEQHEMNNVWSYVIGNKDTQHPTEKPIDMFRWLIQISSNPGDLVFDGFMGSGTTAVAAMKEKRNYIGFELNDKYFQDMQKRINHFQPEFDFV